MPALDRILRRAGRGDLAVAAVKEHDVLGSEPVGEPLPERSLVLRFARDLRHEGLPLGARRDQRDDARPRSGEPGGCGRPRRCGGVAAGGEGEPDGGGGVPGHVPQNVSVLE